MKPFAAFIDLSAVEGKALSQFYDAMKQDFVLRGAMMPDVHAGYSLPIGSAVATDGVIVPSYVGYDIGCGMCALPLSGPSRGDIAGKEGEILNAIYAAVPVGQAAHGRSQAEHTELDVADLTEEAQAIARKRGWDTQLGTLGGGNHFIELGHDETGRLWVVIHSGSRGTGHGIAEHYMKMASGSHRAEEGHHALPVDSDLGLAYLNDMEWALLYALDNRKRMMELALQSIGRVVGASSRELWTKGALINRNHNHATLREVDGRQAWIHRKGATHAEEGMDGVIPGNMRDGSFIVRGKGNPESLYSSSHGAGRVLSRAQAKKTVNLGDFEETMQGIAARVSESTIDESPFVYKDVFEVMAMQKDLVEVVHHVRPLVNVKG